MVALIAQAPGEVRRPAAAASAMAGLNAGARCRAAAAAGARAGRGSSHLWAQPAAGERGATERELSRSDEELEELEASDRNIQRFRTTARQGSGVERRHG